MKVEVEAIEGCKRRLAVEAPADVVQQEWERAYVRVQKQARLPGFRKGYVPRSLVKLHFADDVRREVAEHLIPDVYRRALSEAHLDPVNEPDLQEVKLEEGAPLSFVAVVEVKPSIELGEVKEKVLPELDDEFAKSLGKFASLAALRAELRRELEARRAEDERRELQEGVVDAVLAGHHFTVPDAMVMRHVAHQIEHARESMRQQGLDPDRVPWDYGKLITELRPGAEKAVRRALLLEAIAEREAIEPTDTDVDAELEKVAQASRRPVPAVRRMMEKNGDLEALRRGLRDRRTLEVLVGHARIRA